MHRRGWLGVILTLLVAVALTAAAPAGAQGTAPAIHRCLFYPSATLVHWDTSYLRDNYGSSSVIFVQFRFTGALFQPRDVRIEGDNASVATPPGAVDVEAFLLLENGREVRTDAKACEP